MTEAKRSPKKRRSPVKPDVDREEPEAERRTPAPRAPQTAPPPAKAAAPSKPAPPAQRAVQSNPGSVDAYMMQMYFDEQKGLYVGTIAEIPEMRVEGETQEEVVTTLTRDLEDFAIDREHDGSPMPVPLSAKTYPSKLSVTLSQDLYRRLELRSIQEKIELERLASEILAEGLQKRGGTETRSRQPSNNSAQGHDRNGNDRHGNRENQGGRHNNRRGGRQHSGGPNRKRGFDYHGTMDSRENFMDYVRKLEKGQRK